MADRTDWVTTPLPPPRPLWRLQEYRGGFGVRVWMIEAECRDVPHYGVLGLDRRPRWNLLRPWWAILRGWSAPAWEARQRARATAWIARHNEEGT